MAIIESELLSSSSSYTSPFLVSSILVLIFIFLSTKYLFGKNENDLKLPPSPPKLPIIGNLHQLVVEGKGQPPHRSLQALSKKYGPKLMHLQLGSVQALVVSSADVLEEIVKHHDVVFSSRPITTGAKIMFYGESDFGFAPYGEYWKQAKKVCVTHLLSNKRVESFKFAREEGVASLIDQIRRRSSYCVNLTEMLRATSHHIITRCVMGQMAARDADGKFGELSKRYTSLLLNNFCFGDLFPRMGGWVDVLTGNLGRIKATFHEMDAFLDSLIEQEQQSIDEDDEKLEKNFVQILLHLHKDRLVDFTRDNLKAILLDMLVAAVEATLTIMEWAMSELMNNPEKMKKAQEEVRRVVGESKKGKVDEDDVVNQMPYLKCVVKETLRLHPPLALLPRQISTRIKVMGHDVLPKTWVIVNAWAIQTDPKLWDNPKDFVPERFENNPINFKGQQYFQFIPFGVGRRSCPGDCFTVSVAECAIANLLYWFDWKLPAGDDVHPPRAFDMSESFGFHPLRKFPLQLVPVNYVSC